MSDIFDRAFFDMLGRLYLPASVRPDRGLVGARKSSAKGSSVEFSDFREYIPGDDPRRIDWNAYGRFDRLYVKQFMEEKEVFYHIVLDSSGSMDYGEPSKRIMALRLCGACAYMIGRQMDRVQIDTLSDGQITKSIALKSKNAFAMLLGELEKLVFSGRTDLEAGIQRLRFNGRGNVILISDFLDPKGIEGAIRYLTFMGQKTTLMRVCAREEEAFTEEGSLELKDKETGEVIRVTMSPDTLSRYGDRLVSHENELRRICRRYDCKYIKVCADEEPGKALIGAMMREGILCSE